MATKLVVVVGATGSQGSAVISWIKAHEPTWSIRGLTRNVSSDAAKGLASKDIEMVTANSNDLASLQSAFKGANYIYAYTDFGSIMSDCMGRFAKGEMSPPIGLEANKIEQQHGRNIADAAAGVRGLERLVFSYQASVEKLSQGKYTKSYHFEAKASIAEYMLGLDALKGKVSLCQLGVFNTNTIKLPDFFGIRKQPDGTALWSPPLAAETLLPWIDIEADLGSYVTALIAAPHAPIEVLCVSEWLTGPQWLELWSKHTGILARYEASDGIHQAVEPTGIAEQMSQTMRFMDEFGMKVQEPGVLMPEDLAKEGVAVQQTKVADYIAREDWSSIVG
nr:hypothetical protein B0A51_12500 [Rachicladosporium sp. CCFEE 5018]